MPGLPDLSVNVRDSRLTQHTASDNLVRQHTATDRPLRQQRNKKKIHYVLIGYFSGGIGIATSQTRLLFS